MSSDLTLANLPLTPDVLRENDPDPRRVLFWLKGDRRDCFQYWERIVGHMLEPGAAAKEFATLPVRVTPFRQRIGGDLGKLFSRFRGGDGPSPRGFILPTGEWAEPLGQPREDALLAWTANGDTRPGTIDEIWPAKETCKRLGPQLFLVVGVTAPPSPPAPTNGNGKHVASSGPIPVTKHDKAPSVPEAQNGVPEGEGGLSDRDVQQWLQRMSRQVSFHCSEGYWPLALSLAQKVLKWVRKRRGEEHPQVAACLNQVARVHHLRGDMASAEPVYREALRMNGQIVGIGHPSFATGLNNLALLHQSLGDRAAAEELHRQALDIRVASLGEGHPLVATSQNNLGSMYLSAGEPKTAEPLLTQAVESIRAALGPEHPDLAVCLHNLAAACRALGEDERGSQLAEQARRIGEVSAGRDYLRIAESLNILAEFSGEDARLRAPTVPVEPPAAVATLDDEETGVLTAEPWAAEPPVEDAAALVAQGEPLLMESDAHEAGTLEMEAMFDPGADGSFLEDNIQGAAELWEADVSTEEAAAFLEQPPQIWVPPAIETIEVQNNGADDLILEEVPSCKQADDGNVPPMGQAPDLVIEEVFPGGDIDGAKAVLAESSLEDLVLEEVPSEEDLVLEEVPSEERPEQLPLPEASGRAEELPPAAHTDCTPLQDLEAGSPAEDDTDYWGDLVVTGDEPDDAASPAERSDPADVPAPVIDPAVEGEAPPDSSDTITDPADLIRVADQSRDAGDYRGAEALYRRVLEMGRSSSLLPGSAQQAHALNGLALTCAATGRASEALERLFQVLAIDSDLLAEALTSRGDRRDIRLYWVRADVNAILALTWQRLANSSEAVQAALDVALRYKEIDLELLARPPESLSDLEIDLRSADRHAVAEALPADSVLVEVVRVPQVDFHPVAADSDGLRKGARYLGFVLAAGEPDDARLIDLGEAEEIDRLAAAFRASITGVRNEASEPRLASALPRTGRGHDRELGAELRRAIFDPLTAALGGRSRLFLAPAVDLACLPFEVLPTEENGYVLDGYHISYLTAGRDVLRFGRGQKCEPGAPVVGGDPDFDLGLPAAPAALGTTAAPGAWLLEPDRESSPTIFPRLLGTRRGAMAIAELLGVDPLLAGSVRKNALQALHAPWILHLATHCYFSSEEPGASVLEPPSGDPRSSVDCGLVLSGANRQRHARALPALGMQGFLTAEEIAGLNLSGTELVVLPACAAGGVGDQLVRLRQAFVRAGADTVVMSQWKTPDWHAKVLLVDFYRRLLDGEGRADALRQAQLALRRQYPDRPGCWGAFLCHGDPGPLRGRMKKAKR